MLQSCYSFCYSYEVNYRYRTISFAALKTKGVKTKSGFTEQNMDGEIWKKS